MHMDHDKPTPLRKFDSVVMLERLDSNASSSYALLRQDTGPRSVNESARTDVASMELGEVPPTPIGLDVSIRFGHLGVLMALSLSTIVVLTVKFNRGVVLGHFNPSTKDADATKRLLDDYNSYSGNVASLFGRPIEIFVALAVHILILRVLAASLLRTEISWRMDALTLVLSAGVGYLISNGLNALNVQPQAPTIKPIISVGDLSYVPGLNTSNAAAGITNLSRSFSELQERNPITNTVLRNLVLPRVTVTKPYCNWTTSVNTMDNQYLPDLLLEYGFSQRDWHSRLLPEAIKPKQLRIVTNPTNKSVNDHVVPQDLPMNASLAADLFIIWGSIKESLFPWSDEAAFDYRDLLEGHANQTTYESLARLVGLLPPMVPAQDEMAQRQWFLRESAVQLTKDFKAAVNTSRSNVEMEFSHVDISSTMRFDAITIDIEVDPAILAESVDKSNAKTRYSKVYPEYQCGPWIAQCMMPKPRFASDESRSWNSVFDPPAQVRAFGSCVNSQGTEELVMEAAEMEIDCPQMSNTSLMVMSIGKRFIADFIGESTNASNGSVSYVVTNLRRIYSLTVGKLSWDLSDLAVDFNAECGEELGSCKGLHFPLISTATNPSDRQELIVGVDALPMDVLELPVSERPSYEPLVRVLEPQPMANGESDIRYDSLAGDPLLLHNVGEITWHTEKPFADESTCNAFFEQRLRLILNNHMYIEHGLQTAYTAATFFLLQNGVVKDVVNLNTTQHTLNFQQNTLNVALLASIPDQNARLTIGGCIILAFGLCAVVTWAWVTSKTATGDRAGGLGHISTPHVVARVMLDSVHFPPLFLHRRVIGVNSATEDDKQAPPSVDRFAIDKLTLQPLRKENGTA